MRLTVSIEAFTALHQYGLCVVAIPKEAYIAPRETLDVVSLGGALRTATVAAIQNSPSSSSMYQYVVLQDPRVLVIDSRLQE